MWTSLPHKDIHALVHTYIDIHMSVGIHVCIYMYMYVYVCVDMNTYASLYAFSKEMTSKTAKRSKV